MPSSAQVDIARNHPALLILQGNDDAMLSSRDAVALRDALAPLYKSPRDEPRLRLALVDGLSHGWADSAHAERNAPLDRGLGSTRLIEEFADADSSSTTRRSCSRVIAATRMPRKSAATRAC
jgi:hypothetical protein